MNINNWICPAADCSICTHRGICPAELEFCDDCGEELYKGESHEVEVNSSYGRKTIKVCPECYPYYAPVEIEN